MFRLCLYQFTAPPKRDLRNWILGWDGGGNTDKTLASKNLCGIIFHREARLLCFPGNMSACSPKHFGAVVIFLWTSGKLRFYILL